MSEKPEAWAGQPAKEFKFVADVIASCQTSKGDSAKLRRASNPSLEHQSWGILARLGVDLNQESQRLAACTVAAAIATAKPSKNGSMLFGRAFAVCYTEGKDAAPAEARLRRLLACNDLQEVCRVIRPLFQLILAKTKQDLDYARLLIQLKSFQHDPQKIKAQWAQDFYGGAA